MWSTGCVEGWMPTAAMVATNIVIAIMTALLKQALNQGMNRLVLITFRQMLATVFLGPIASTVVAVGISLSLIIHMRWPFFPFRPFRKTRPRITAEIFGYLFLSGILGPVLLQYTLFVGLEYTTATFAATFGNLLPVVTFLISLAFGYEALEVRSKSGSAKISGTLLSLTGAMMLTFYKGASLTHFHHLAPSSAGAPAAAGVEEQHRSAVRWVLGSAAMLANVAGFAAWLLLQRRLTRLYPALYSATAVMSLLSFVQAAALALSTQWGAGVAAWRLQGTVEVVAVVYCGVVASGVGYLMLTYCVEKRGPVFTAAFSPLAQMFVAGIDLCVLHEPLYLGSVLGSVLVILGLYLVLWGKREEVIAAAAAAPVKPAQGDVAEQQERV